MQFAAGVRASRRYLSVSFVIARVLYPQPLQFPALTWAFDYPAERTISSSPQWLKMPGARGIVTAFARILVSEPCRPLEDIAMPALAADNPSPDLPAIHPILTCRFRRKGPLFKAYSMLTTILPRQGSWSNLRSTRYANL